MANKATENRRFKKRAIKDERGHVLQFNTEAQASDAARKIATERRHSVRVVPLPTGGYVLERQ